MTEAIINILGALTGDGFEFFLLSIPFWGYERIKRHRVYIIVALLMLIRATWSYVSIIYIPGGITWNVYFYTAYLCLVFAVHKLIFKVNAAKLLYTLLVLVHVGTMINYAAWIINVSFHAADVYIHTTLGNYITKLILWILITPFAYRICKNYFRKAFSILPNKSILKLCVVPAVLYVFLSVYAYVFTSVEMNRVLETVFDVCVMAVGIVSCYMNLQMVVDTANYMQNERKLSEEKSLLESLNRTKSEFYGNISHELKTPLTIIVTDMELAEQFIDEGNIDSAKELIREACHKGMQTADIITDALAFARGQEVSRAMEYMDFSNAINSTLNIFEPLILKHGNTLERNIASLPQIKINLNMITDALINILFNANRHTADGIISVRWREENEIYILTVKDNGSGISPQLLPRVFERGVSGGSGTGLGLTLVKNVVDAHGGEVTIESQLEEGTTVTLTFPAEVSV